MNSFGGTVKRLRVQKDLKMAYVYHGIISKTYAIKFEKGEGNISTDKLLRVLSRMEMSIQEFLFFHGHNEESDYQRHFKQVVEMLEVDFRGQDDEVARQIAFLDQSQDYLCRLLSKVLLVLFEENKFEYHHIQKNRRKEIQYIENYFLDRDFWSLEEIKLFTITLGIFQAKIREILLTESLKIIDRYTNYPSFRVGEQKAILIENHIMVCFRRGELAGVDRWIKELENIAYPVELVTRSIKRMIIRDLYAVFMDEQKKYSQKEFCSKYDFLNYLEVDQLFERFQTLYFNTLQKMLH